MSPDTGAAGIVNCFVPILFLIRQRRRGYFGKDLVINEFIYDSFLFITLGCFGIAEIGKIFGNKGSAPAEEPAPEPEEPKERPGININIDGDDW